MATKKANPAKKAAEERTIKKSKTTIQKNSDLDTTLYSFMYKGVEFEMTESQRLFALEFVRSQFKKTASAVAAGYTQKNPDYAAYELLKNPQIQLYVKMLQDDLAFKIGIDAEKIAREYAKIGFADIRKIFNKDGSLMNIHDFTEDMASNVASVEVFEEFEGFGRDRTQIGYTKKIRMHDKINALDKLAKMLGVDGITRVAQVNKEGEDVETKPLDLSSLTDEELQELANKIKNK